jgi:CheY-like chemotaxis protein
MLTKPKILIAEDDALSLRMLTHYLQGTGYEYVTAFDGYNAWELLQQTPEQFQLVITDRIMPRLHGLQLLEKMKNHPLLAKIPVLMLTGVADKEEIIEAIRAGVHDFLYKPLEKELLLSVIKRTLR